MNEHVLLFKWVRSEASINIARILKIKREIGPPGQETLKVEVKLEQTLWGETGEPVRICSLNQHLSETTRLKFPDPIWGRVNLQEGAYLLFVTSEPAQIVREPVYVEQYYDSHDPIISEINLVLEAEKIEQNADQRITRYVQWLNASHPVPLLFAGEALASDQDLLPVDETGQVANAFANGFSTQSDLFVRITLGTWMWEDIFSRTNNKGEVAIINATILGVDDPSEDVRRFSLERLITIEDADKLLQPGILKDNKAVPYLMDELKRETSSDSRNRIEDLIKALTE